MSHDSIGRYDGYNDRFNVGGPSTLKDPEEVFRSLTVPSKDTIAPSQEKIDAEIINRLQANADGIPNDKLPVVARAGKYIFMAVAVPTYLLTYSIPKWIAVQLIPNTCQLLNKGLKQCFKPMQELVMQLLRQFERLQKVFRRERTKATKTESHFKGLMAMLKYPFGKMKALWQMAKLKISERKSALQDLLGEIKKGVKERLKAAGDSAKRTATRMIYGRLTKEEPLAPWRQKLLALANTIYRAYKYTTALPGRIYNATKKVIVENYMTYIFPHVDFVRTKITNTYKKVVHRYNKVATYVRARKDAVVNAYRKFVAKQTERLKKATEAVKEAIIRTAIQVSNALGLPKVVQFTVQAYQTAQNAFQWVSNKIQKSKNWISNKVQFGKHKVKNLASSALNGAKQIIQSGLVNPLINAFYRLTDKPRSLASRGSRSVKKLFKATFQRVSSIRKTSDKLKHPALVFRKWKERGARKARRAAYYTRLSASWTRILAGFWMMAVRNTCQTCVDHFTWKDIVYFLKNMGQIFNSFLRKLAEKSKKKYRKVIKAKPVA